MLLKLNDLIPFMRGETSAPLIRELQKILESALNEEFRRASVQIDSNLVSRGLTLVLNFDSSPIVTAAIFLSRLEIPGFLPSDTKRTLQDLGWSVLNDRFGQKYIVVTRKMKISEAEVCAEELSFALETLGAPQRQAWLLDAFYE